MECIFCKIIRNEIASIKLYEDEKIIAFLDIAPATEGHTLVIPKKHYETLFDIPPDEWGILMKAVKKIAHALFQNLHAEGINVFNSNYQVAGQVISHLHFHIIPRWNNDGQSFSWKPHKASAEILHQVKQKIGMIE